jgi:hypothetical protein
VTGPVVGPGLAVGEASAVVAAETTHAAAITKPSVVAHRREYRVPAGTSCLPMARRLGIRVTVRTDIGMPFWSGRFGDVIKLSRAA